MGLDLLLERWGEDGVLAGGALLIGMVFGFMAQRSRFCLRSAVIEFARNLLGGRLTVWRPCLNTANTGALVATARAGNAASMIVTSA